MLINALCDYYDILASQNKVLPEGYSNVGVDFLVSITSEGKIDDIVDWRDKGTITDQKGKTKDVFSPRQIILPKRSEKPAIDANIIEHRAVYLFGLNLDGTSLSPTDEKGKAEKSHESFVLKNLSFIDGIDTPVVNAYRNFIKAWVPADETENQFILSIGKGLAMAKLAFCLSGHPELLLHEDAEVKAKWSSLYRQSLEPDTDDRIGQCAVTGQDNIFAKLHNKISGLPGGQSMGNLMVCFNNASDCSYSDEQAYNSKISVSAMTKYTEALNYLVKNRHHRTVLDDITVLHWAMSKDGEKDDLISSLIFGSNDVMDSGQVELMLDSLLKNVREGSVTAKMLVPDGMISPEVDYYMVGLKPNSSRIAMKFIYRRKYGELMKNVVLHQNDFQISARAKPVSLWQIKKELISPKSKNEAVSPSLLANIFESIVYAYPYPDALLYTIVRRVKTDSDTSINTVRAGIIKACINRKSRFLNQKEELKMALDTENSNRAYLCGRLFAALEKLQQEASGNSLNRTIKDAYFSSAASRPATIFPTLIKLAQNHMKKSEREVFFRKLIGEIADGLDGGFPENLSLTEQGKFIVGYYQQYQSFFVKNNKTEEE